MEAIQLPHPPEREVWRAIPDAPGYEVSTAGRVRSYRQTGKGSFGDGPAILAARLHEGYPIARICVGGKGKTKLVHRLLLLAFVGPPPVGKDQARHLDGVRANSTINNLAWGSKRENEDDRIRHGMSMRGEEANGVKLTERMVVEIVRCVRAGEKQTVVGPMFGVAHTTVSRIMNGETWQWLTGIERKPRRPQRRRLVAS